MCETLPLTLRGNIDEDDGQRSLMRTLVKVRETKRLRIYATENGIILTICKTHLGCGSRGKK